MRDVLTGVYARRKFVVVPRENDQETVVVAARRLEEYLGGMFNKRTIPLRNDVRRGVYTVGGKTLPMNGRELVLAIVRDSLDEILLCGFSRSDSGVIGYRLDLREFHEAISRGVSRRLDERHEDVLRRMLEEAADRERESRSDGNGTALEAGSSG